MSSTDLSSKCRTCLSASQVYHQLFDYVEENYKILEMLDGIVPQIDIKTSSQFSTLVCESCVDKLLTGYKFQQLCIETNNRLHDLLGLAVFETAPKLEKILDPLTGEESFKMKQEMPEEEFENEINPGDLLQTIESDNDNDWGPLDDEGGGGSVNESGNETDSSNEKLSILKERSNKKPPSKTENSENTSKQKSPRGSFPCSQCSKVFSSLNRLKQHTSIHEKKQAYSCDICTTSFKNEKALKSHKLTHTNSDIAVNETERNLQENQNLNKEHKPFENNEDLESKDDKVSKELLTFQCPDCPKIFEKKASLSAHYKVHKKLKKLDKSEENDNENNKELDNKLEECKVIVKEEIEVTPQIFEEPIDDDINNEDNNTDWFNDNEPSNDDSENEFFAKPRAKETKKNLDFIDTGVGEIEKPNSSNKRSGHFPCKMCGKVFDRPYRLKRHSSVHSPSRPHECEICKYRFTTINILKSHLFQHENESGLFLSLQSRPEGFKCPDCPRRFEKQASLSAHRQIHTRNASEANYPCMVCQRNFMSVRSLTEHITNKHPEVEKHKCDQCDKTFVLHAHLVEHLNRHKGNRNLVCLICEKEFGYTNTLKEHMRTHSGESPYLCPQCGKTFRSASNLRQHMERHTGLKKYQCPECPSRFNCRSDLIKHSSTHSNAKPHVCDMCGSRFTRAYSLQKHKLLHSGERPFKCDQCNMTFAIVYHLRRHMRTHTGEKPYKCKYCERAYAESGDLTKHLRTHVGENTYMCDQCPMAFKYQAELRQHQSEHYKMQQKLLQEQQKQALEQEQQQESVPTTIESPLQNETNSFGPKIDNSSLVVSSGSGFFPRKELPEAAELLQQQQQQQQNNENMYTSGMQYLPLAIHQLQEVQQQTQQQQPEKKEDIVTGAQQQDNLDFKKSN